MVQISIKTWQNYLKFKAQTHGKTVQNLGHNEKTKSDRKQHNNSKIIVQNLIKIWQNYAKFKAQTHGKTVQNMGNNE